MNKMDAIKYITESDDQHFIVFGVDEGVLENIDIKQNEKHDFFSQEEKDEILDDTCKSAMKDIIEEVGLGYLIYAEVKRRMAYVAFAFIKHMQDIVKERNRLNGMGDEILEETRAELEDY